MSYNGPNRGWAWAVVRWAVNCAVIWGVAAVGASLLGGGVEVRGGVFLGVILGVFTASFLRLLWSGQWNEPVRFRHRR